MAENDQFITGMLRGIQSGISDLRSEMRESIGKLEERMANLERRQTASYHFEQSVLSHLTSIHESIDQIRVELLGMDRRVKVLETR